ncbi:MAG: GIY-YIG nuclease family protein [Ignavibacteria bacterium]|nr:GIY-YIG nuclease family protein [Ignavibacteria bacterium]
MEDKKYYYVYILSAKINGTLYIGVTGNLVVRVLEHRLKMKKGFSEKYDLFRLVYYEVFEYIDLAIKREKQLKKWNREWKIALIEKENKEWRDLLPDIADKELIMNMTDMIVENKEMYEE